MTAGELDRDRLLLELAAEDLAVGGHQQLPRAELADVDQADHLVDRELDRAVERGEFERRLLERAAVLVAGAELDDVEQVAAEDLEVADEVLPAREVDDQLAERGREVLHELGVLDR